METHKNTKHKLITRIYNEQVSSCKRRGHERPKYSKEWFTDWCLSQDKFHNFYKIWEAKGYTMDNKPSVDRLDDYKTYDIDNIQIMTWKQNREKYYKDKIEGRNNKNSKAVIQMDLKGNIIQEFHSIAEAGRKTTCTPPRITDCCKGKYLSTKGYKWTYKYYLR